MLNDVVYYVEPTNDQDASLTSAHYIVAADSLRAPNASCGTGLLEGFSLTQKSWKIFLKSLEIWQRTVSHAAARRTLYRNCPEIAAMSYVYPGKLVENSWNFTFDMEWHGRTVQLNVGEYGVSVWWNSQKPTGIFFIWKGVNPVLTVERRSWSLRMPVEWIAHSQFKLKFPFASCLPVISDETSQLLTADSAPDPAACGVNLRAQPFVVAIYAGIGLLRVSGVSGFV